MCRSTPFVIYHSNPGTSYSRDAYDLEDDIRQHLAEMSPEQRARLNLILHPSSVWSLRIRMEANEISTSVKKDMLRNFAYLPPRYEDGYL